MGISSCGPWPLVHKGNSKFEILLVKIFSPKQQPHKKKEIKYSQLFQKKSNFASCKKQPMIPLDIAMGLQWRYVKQKSFRKIQIYSGIF